MEFTLKNIIFALMVQKILYLLRVIPKLGIANVAYIFGYRLSMKSGIRKRRFPAGGVYAGEFFPAVKIGKQPEGPDPDATIEKAEEVMKGFFTWYHHHQFESGSIPNWFYDPFSEKELHAGTREKHWTEINEFDLNTGDIKNLWELSRFDWLTVLGRAYAITGEERYRDRIHSLLNDWSSKNPVNIGINWRCGQETSIRVMKLFQVAMMWGILEDISDLLFGFVLQHLNRIRKNIGYAIAQDNNHGTSEAAVLYIGAAWLLRQSSSLKVQNEKILIRYKDKGRELLERRIRKLILKEGTFSQKSVNYHRVAVDTMSFVLDAMERFEEPPLEDDLADRLTQLGEWLLHMVSNDQGHVPVTGANDGAMFETLHHQDYRDYRPSLQLYFALLKGERIWDDSRMDEVLIWRGIDPQQLRPFQKTAPESEIRDREFVHLSYKEISLWIHATQDNFRPGNDVLHLDLWYDGQNILGDSGSYSYNAPESPYFKSIAAHNTLQFGEEEPMPLLSRFLNGKWVKVKGDEKINETEEMISWKGAYLDYRNNEHTRSVMIRKKEKQLILEDSFVSPHEAEPKVLRFHLRDARLRDQIVIQCRDLNGNQLTPKIEEGWHSLYYNHKIAHPVIVFTQTGISGIFDTLISFKKGAE